MRERASQVEYDEEQYNYANSSSVSATKKRLDLNDLLKRAKNQELNDKKNNLIIYGSVSVAILVFIVVFTIY